MGDQRQRDTEVPQPAPVATPLEPVPLAPLPAGRSPAGDVTLARMAIRLGRVSGNQAVARRLTKSRATLARQLVASGTQADFDRFRALVEPAIGLQLGRDGATNVVTPIATLADPATSPALTGILNGIMNDATQNAEVHFGEHQARVAVGAFPQPSDMTGSREQRIDLDDVEAIETGAPGNGVAKLAHEINENYVAHANAPAPGVDRFGPAHEAGVAAESAVAQDLAGPGSRTADRDSPGANANEFFRNQDFQDYILVFKLTRSGTDFTVSEARRAAPVIVNTYTIDHFVTGSDAVPAAGTAAITAASADLAGHPAATCFVEGFTDNVGATGVNSPLSERRARQVRERIVGTGIAVGRGSFGLFGRGATNFITGNATEEERARNRRVVITVREPAAP
jgi:outer membrane protein OmpA-like peptidoglycan-associated protein